MGRNLPYSIRQSALYRGTFCVSISPTAFSCHFLFMAVGLRWALSGSITSILTVLVEKTIFGFISRFPRFWQVNSGIFPQPYRPARPANIDTEECTLPCTWKCSRLWGVLKLSRGKYIYSQRIDCFESPKFYFSRPWIFFGGFFGWCWKNFRMILKGFCKRLGKSRRGIRTRFPAKRRNW